MNRKHFPTRYSIYNSPKAITKRFPIIALLSVALLSVASVSFAQNSNQALANFLAYVQQNPNLAGVSAAKDIAQAQVEMVLDPVSLEVSGGYVRNDVDATISEGEGAGTSNQVVNTNQASIGLSFRPFAFGDVADELARQNINLSQSEMTYRTTLATLEVNAIEAARNLEIAKQGLELAEEGLSLAQDGLKITEKQFELGAATEAGLRKSRLQVSEAEDQKQSAEDSIVLASLALAQLLSTDPSNINLPEITIPLPVYDVLGEENPNVVQAGFGVRQAEILKGSLERTLFPVAQVSYKQHLNDDSNLEFSIESRTLQPKASYSYTASDLEAPAGNFSTSSNNDLVIGVSLSISPAAIKNLEVADTQLQAAKASVTAAEQQAELERLQLQQGINSAIRSLKTKEQALANAEADFDAVNQRIDLGLAPLIEKQQSFVALSQAKLAVEQAELSILSAVLKTYTSYGVPISEVLNYTSQNTLSQEDN